MRVVENYYMLPAGGICSEGRGRSKTRVLARKVAIYLVRELTDLSFSEIADYFERNTSTVIKHNKEISTALLIDTGCRLSYSITSLKDTIKLEVCQC